MNSTSTDVRPYLNGHNPAQGYYNPTRFSQGELLPLIVSALNGACLLLVQKNLLTTPLVRQAIGQLQALEPETDVIIVDQDTFARAQTDIEPSTCKDVVVIGDLATCNLAKTKWVSSRIILVPSSSSGLEGAPFTLDHCDKTKFPDTVIADARLLAAMTNTQFVNDAAATIAVTLDSIWNHNASSISLALSWRALSLLNNVLPAMLEGHHSQTAWSDFQQAGTLACLAITQTSGAVALSVAQIVYEDAADRYGMFAGLTLPPLIEANRANILNTAFERETLNKTLSIVKSMGLKDKVSACLAPNEFVGRIPAIVNQPYIANHLLSAPALTPLLNTIFGQQSTVCLTAEDFDQSSVRIFSEQEYLSRWKGKSLNMVTIICNSYNHEQYLNRCFKGIFSQDTSYPFEVLVHDDASTDQSQRIILEWQERYPTLMKTILRTQNLRANNIKPTKGIYKYCEGKYIARCEGDDFWIKPDKLEFQVSFLEDNPDFFSCYHNAIELFEETQEFRKQFYNEDTLFFDSEEQQKKIIHPYIHTLMIRNNAEFSDWPEERARMPLGDAFLGSYIGLFGKGAYFGSYFGSVGSRNTTSTFTPLTDEVKNERRILTFYWLAQMHKRNNNQNVADHFFEKCIQQIAAQKP